MRDYILEGGVLLTNRNLRAVKSLKLFRKMEVMQKNVYE